MGQGANPAPGRDAGGSGNAADFGEGEEGVDQGRRQDSPTRIERPWGARDWLLAGTSPPAEDDLSATRNIAGLEGPRFVIFLSAIPDMPWGPSCG